MQPDEVRNFEQEAYTVLKIAYRGATPKIRLYASQRFYVLLQEIRYRRPELYQPVCMLAIDIFLRRDLYHKQKDTILLLSE